jgi:hypothetical protein
VSAENEYILFGFDLSQLVLRARLGWHQLLWGNEAGIRERFYPSVEFFRTATSETKAFSLGKDLGGAGSHVLPAPGCFLPEQIVLLRSLTLPVQAEIFLEQAVQSEVVAHSPFPHDVVCWGHEIVGRESDHLMVAIAMSSRQAVETELMQRAETTGIPREDFEVWADGEFGPIMIAGYAEGARRRRFYGQIRDFLLRSLIGVVGIVFLLSLPSLLLAQSASQLQRIKLETEVRARDVIEIRASLVRLQELLDQAEAEHGAYVDYGPWLNRIAAITPDTVFLNRLGLEQRVLTVSGLAENAADYQSLLAESSFFGEINAPSAFTRDARAGRERFTLEMTLAERATP